MGILRGISRYRERQKQKDFDKRRKGFIPKYEALVREYKCDWEGIILVIEGGNHALVQLRLRDVTELIEKEEQDEEQKDQVLKNMSIMPNDVSAKARVEIFLRAEGRLPNQEGDNLTAEMCEKFIEKFNDDPKLNYLIPFCKKEIIRILAENKKLIIDGKQTKKI